MIGEMVLFILIISLIGISFYFRGVGGLHKVINYFIKKREEK